MNNIMVDNWFMEQVVADLRRKKENSSKSYANLLMAIVLWDEVYYPENTYSSWNSFPSQVQNVLRPIDCRNEEENDCLTWLSCDDHYMSYDSGFQILRKQKLDIVGAGALRYMKLSNDNECDYLPCEERQYFFSQYDNQHVMQKSLARLKMHGNLDKSIEEYYTDTYKALLDFSDIKLKMPILVNFIFDNTPKGMTPVDYAFHLKNEGAVIKYRKYLSQVEDALEKQNWKDLRFLLRCSSDAVSEITSLDKDNLSSIGVRILPMPSILLKYDGVSADISSTPSFEIKMSIQNPFRRIHLTFLKELTRYAINDMKLWK